MHDRCCGSLQVFLSNMIFLHTCYLVPRCGPHSHQYLSLYSSFCIIVLFTAIVLTLVKLWGRLGTRSGLSLKLIKTRPLTILKKKPFENVVGKGENAGNQYFLLFPQCFLAIQRRISVFKFHLFCRLQILPNWTSPKIYHLIEKSTNIHERDPPIEFKLS